MKPLYITGPEAEATLRIASGAARALTRQGFAVMPWCPRPAEPSQAEQASRALAILADACRLFPDEDFAQPGEEPPAMCHRADLTVALAPPPDAVARLTVRQDDLGLDVGLPGGREVSFPHPRLDPLLPEYPPQVAVLPLYRVGVPRYGVVSLPHLVHFSDYAMLRAAEWVAAPMPGRFDALFFPLSSNPASDREWLALQGLDEWLFTQRAMGCVLYSTGEPVTAHTRNLPRETLLSGEELSAFLGVRFPPPMPQDEVLETLADWWDGSEAAEAVMNWLTSETSSFV